MNNTIVAIATPSGHGGVGIVRLSGSKAQKIAEHITHQPLKIRHAHFTDFYSNDNEIIDQGIAIYFKNPHSFTGEEVVELQTHGSPFVLDQLVQTAIDLGARLAKPGEFTERAFLNKKIDLIQAEAIADLIHASSTQAARSAMRSLQGVFSQKINDLLKKLIHLRMQVEAMIDFPEEEIDFLSDPSVAALLQETINAVNTTLAETKQGVLLQQGLQVVIAGKPNAGKSSLLNYLCGDNRAIVTDIPGTTRDILRESIQIDGLPLHIIDTAGLRETADVIEQEGVRRAHDQLALADIIILVIDANECRDLEKTINEFKNKYSSTVLMVLKNKIDLMNEAASLSYLNEVSIISVSIKKDMGLSLFKDQLKQLAGFHTGENQFIARKRHVDALNRAHDFLMRGLAALQTSKAGELLAEDLRQAQLCLSEITGEFTSDDLLGVIFSSFCIGK